MSASTRMMVVIGVLSLAPGLAPAKSEYAECLAEQHRQRAQWASGPMMPMTRPRVVSFRRYSDSYRFATSAYYLQPGMHVGAMFDGSADRLAAMVRVCRQFKKKPEPPGYRIVGIKSPSLSHSGKRSGNDTNSSPR